MSYSYNCFKCTFLVTFVLLLRNSVDNILKFTLEPLKKKIDLRYKNYAFRVYIHSWNINIS